jgi:general stress protein 26
MTESRIPDGYKMGVALDDEARDALGTRQNATVGTLNADGSINLANVWFLFESGRLYFETASSTRKARNVSGRKVVTVLVSHPDVDVRAEGRGRVILGEEAQAINLRIRAKYETDAAQEDFFSTIDDCAVEVSVDRWRTWRNHVLRAGIRAVRERSSSDPK